MPKWNAAERHTFDSEMSWEERDLPITLYGFLSRAKLSHGSRPAVSFQLLSDPDAPSETLTWDGLHARTTQTANLFRSLGIGPTDTVAYLLPNSIETVATLLGGAVAGIANPINPLLEPDQIASILRETNAKVLVTLKSFPKTDVAQKAAEAVKQANGVTHVLEVDLLRYLTGIKKYIVPFLRPKMTTTHHAKVMGFTEAVDKQPTSLTFDDPQEDRVAAYFHTGGTTGMPKVAQHKYSGMIYNGWIGHNVLFSEEDVLICPLPLFHVMACQPVLMSMISSGGHVVFPTPAGFRGEGVMDNFWKLIERWQVTFLIGVPTAFSALMQRPVNADLSSLKSAVSGSAPLPVELYRRFEESCGINIIEAYGLTECTCLVSGNPTDGDTKIGSVGMPFPYTEVQIVRQTPEGPEICDTDEVGEICVSNPGVFPGGTYTEADKNQDLYHAERFLRTGDLGRLDADGFLWITGRAKDLIIRGGHNIDPAMIEECLAGHPAVAFAGAIGQPDPVAGELPCAFVELVAGASATEEELLAYCAEHVPERAAVPKHMEIVAELPKTAVGKVFKPDLRKSAITRTFNAALAEAGVAAQVVEVIEDKKRGLVAKLAKSGDVEDAAVVAVLGRFIRPWDWA